MVQTLQKLTGMEYTDATAPRQTLQPRINLDKWLIPIQRSKWKPSTSKH